MRTLIAEDDPVSRRLVEVLLRRWGHEALVAEDGEQAWRLLSEQAGPVLAILDWMMPGLDGPEICRRIRGTPALAGSHVLMLTARSSKADVVAGLQAGADDFLGKPFDRHELRARLDAGLRVLALQADLASRVRELTEALARIRRLEGLLPICCVCKKIRQEDDRWKQLEDYVREHSDATFTHGLCPSCLHEHYGVGASKR